LTLIGRRHIGGGGGDGIGFAIEVIGKKETRLQLVSRIVK